MVNTAMAAIAGYEADVLMVLVLLLSAGMAHWGSKKLLRLFEADR